MMKNIIFLSFLFVGCANPSTNTNSVNEAENITYQEPIINDLEIIEKEIIQKPKSPNVYLKRALFFQEKRNFPSALEDINRALLLAPDVAVLKYHKAAILYEFAVYNQDVSLLDESKIYLDNSIAEDLEIIEPRLLRAKIYLFEKKTEESMRLINDVLKIDQRIAEAYLIKGMIYQLLGNLSLSSSSYQTAIEVDPDYFDAYNHLGMLYEKTGKEGAVDYYNSAIAIQPNSIEAHRNKGLYLYFNQEYQLARASFEEVKRIDPYFEEAYFNIGNTYLGDFDMMNDVSSLDSAFFYFNTAYQMNNEYVQAIHNIGLCHEIKKDLVKAKFWYQQAIDLDNNFEPSLDAMNALD